MARYQRAHRNNVVGAQVQKLRYKKGLTQEMFAARCARYGWDISRSMLSKIEAQLRHVTDWELLVIAKTLSVPLEELYPPKMLLPKH
jgi:transcriptional regulator with XRE-family HTH domain